MVPDIGGISAGHSHTLIPIMTESAVLEGRPHALPPATIVAYAIPQPMEAPITRHTMIQTGMVNCILHLPLLSWEPLTQLHRLELVSLQQLMPHITRISAQESQAMPKTLSPL